jgi:hypothetical protein
MRDPRASGQKMRSYVQENMCRDLEKYERPLKKIKYSNQLRLATQKIEKEKN